MFQFLRCYPGDRDLDFLLVVISGVALVSSAACLISRRLSGKAALQHLVLFSALISCSAIPAIAWICATAGLTLVSIPMLHSEQFEMAPAVAQIESDPATMTSCPLADPPAVTDQLDSPHTNTMTEPSNELGAARMEVRCPDASMLPNSKVESGGHSAAMSLSFRTIATGATFVWAAGALLLLARLTLNCVRVVHLRRSSRLLKNESHLSLAREIAIKLEMRRVPLLLVSSRAVTPVAVGFGRAAIILPEHVLTELTSDEMRDVLTHEMAHLRRADQRILLAQELARALYWPIVSVHGLNRELSRVREELCDNVVLAGRDAISYGKTLLHVAELVLKARAPVAAVGIFGRQGQLERRIAGLIEPRRNTTTTTGRKVACFVMFSFIAVSAAVAATRFATLASAAAGAPVGDYARKADFDLDDPKYADHFTGRVTGPDGKPLSGCQVFALPSYGESKAPGPVRAMTDDDGRFAFDAPDLTYTALDGLPARREALLVVTRRGYGPDWFQRYGADHRGMYSHRDLVRGRAIAMQLAVDNVPIHGRFLDADGRPLAGASVRLACLIIPRQHDLSAHLEQEKTRPIIFALPGYERELYEPNLLPGVMTETKTDADGRFTMSGLGEGRLAELSVSAPSVIDTTLTVMTRDAPDLATLPGLDGRPTQVIHGAGFTLRLERGLTVTGRVIDRDTGKPIAGMWVEEHQHRQVTDEKGRFTISGLDPGILKRNNSASVIAISPPGLPYQTAGALIKADSEVLIKCRRGIPFRLKVVDEQGKPVQAEASYTEVEPNPHVVSLIPGGSRHWPIAPARRLADGSYQGFVLPGPGAVLIKTPGRQNYRPAHVDPKTFFAPGRTNWSAQERISTYGTHDTLETRGGGWVSQHDYAAIVLVNPPPGSGPLELAATVANDRPRRVSLIDPAGNALPGVTALGMTFVPWGSYTLLRGSSFFATGLNPDRAKRLTFIKEDRRLIACLLVRDDRELPITVRMQPWGTVTGRIVDEHGNAFPMADVQGNSMRIAMGRTAVETNLDPELGDYFQFSAFDSTTRFDPMTGFDTAGRFRIERLVPGQRYSAEIHRGLTGISVGTAFDKLVLRPGEVRDLGAIRMKTPVGAKSTTKPAS
jgi:beta-lactamase regulating signal transducer with metallopeptidase domain